MVKRFLQYFIVKTDFGPLAWIYRACYAIALKRIVQVFKRQDDVVAIYLISSMAAGDHIPGLSDIDLIIIVKDAPDSKSKISRCYAQISRRIPFLKNDEQDIFTVREVRSSYILNGFFLKYKFFTECRRQGTLLYGRDILRDFNELDIPQRNEFIVGQLAFIWAIFLKNFLIKKKIPDTFIQNYFCYKLTSDTCKAFISACDGQDIFNRKKALEYSNSYFDESRKAHMARMNKLAQQKFFGYFPSVLEDTYDFCVNTFRDTIACMPSLPDSEEDKKENQETYYDLNSVDFILSDRSKQTIGIFVDRINNKYRDYVRSVFLAPVNLFHIEEQNIGLFIVPQKHIPLDIIKELIAILKSQDCPQCLYLYVIISDVVISLNRLDHVHTQSVLFSLRWMSATFLYLKTPHAILWGEPLSCFSSKKLVKNYFWGDVRGAIEEDKIIIRRLIADQQIRRVVNVEFQLFFWQAIRLKLIEDSIDAGKIFFPLSSKQVYRGWNNTQELRLTWLEKFHQEYIKDLNGFPSNSEAYFSKALSVLKDIYETNRN